MKSYPDISDAPLRCDRCAQAIPPAQPRQYTAVYARTDAGAVICYPCADTLHRAEILAPDTTDVCAYVSSDEKTITTWTGGALMRITSRTRTRAGFGGWRKSGGLTAYRATDSIGREWYGRGAGAGCFIHLRLIRAAIRAGQMV